MKTLFWAATGKKQITEVLQQTKGIDYVITDDKEATQRTLPGTNILIMGGAWTDYDFVFADIVRKTCPDLKLILVLSAGYEGFERNYVPPTAVVAGQAGTNAPPAAEHAMMMLLALTRCMPEIASQQARHVWDRDTRFRLGTLEGRTMAVVGFGHIGKQIAKRARAFDMKIIAVTRTPTKDPLADAYYPLTEIKTAFAQTDVVAVAAPGIPETKNLIGAPELAALKKGAVLINVGRGIIVEPLALRAALQSGHLSAAGLDVVEPEPLPKDDPLWDMPNVIVSPHIAGAGSDKSLERMAATVKENLERFLAGRELINILKL